jgi:hypothetical protein
MAGISPGRAIIVRTLLYGCGGIAALLVYDWINRHAPHVTHRSLTLIVMVVLIVWALRYTLGSSHSGITAHFNLGSGSADREYVARHEMGHALAFKAGGFNVDEVVADHQSGHTCASGSGHERDYLVALAAGAEAAARYLVEYHGYGWRNARDKAYGDAGTDMRTLRAEAGYWERSRVESETEDFVRKNWREIDQEAAKLAQRDRIRNY